MTRQASNLSKSTIMLCTAKAAARDRAVRPAQEWEPRKRLSGYGYPTSQVFSSPCNDIVGCDVHCSGNLLLSHVHL